MKLSAPYVPLESRHGIRPTSGSGTVKWFGPHSADRWGGFYPACTKHGAMNRVHPTLRMWRCLADEWTCNCGLIHKDDVQPVPTIRRTSDGAIPPRTG